MIYSDFIYGRFIDNTLCDELILFYENNEFKVIGDNRNIKDDKSCQKLSTNEIVNMRKKGESGNEIINKLIENSATFGMKT